MAKNDVADALRNVLVSVNESDSNGEAANVVDGLYAIARALDRVADAIDNHTAATQTATGNGRQAAV